jgi:hypothetical protein
MIRSAIQFPAALVAVTAVLLVAAGLASGAVVSGSNLAAEPNNETCIAPPATSLSCTITIASLPPASRAPGGFSAGISGVIVEWKIRTTLAPVDTSVRLRVVRDITGVGSGPVVTLPKAAGIHPYLARVPVQAGDQIGIDIIDVELGQSPRVIRSGVAEALFRAWIPPLADGKERDHTFAAANFELTMNATIEPDADGDAYGDETQDACPTVANAGGPCPPPPLPSAPAPDTKITKGPKGKTDTRRATFKFRSEPAGATFQCKLDKKPFKPCKSPKTYKGLSEGKHTFKVRAVSASGAVDATPAKRAFRVDG